MIRSAGPTKTVVRWDGDLHLTAVFNTHLTPEGDPPPWDIVT